MVLALVQHILVTLVKREKTPTNVIVRLHVQAHTMPLVHTALKTFFRSKCLLQFRHGRLAKDWNRWMAGVHLRKIVTL